MKNFLLKIRDFLFKVRDFLSKTLRNTKVVNLAIWVIVLVAIFLLLR